MSKLEKLSSAVPDVISNTKIFQGVMKALKRERLMLEHRKVSRFWRKNIRLYFGGKIEVDQITAVQSGIAGKKIIWQYWAQGLSSDTLPELVRICFESVDKFKGEYNVIRLTDETIEDYIKLPQYVWEKRKSLDFKPVFFSDLLRVALLNHYGGIWLDATILLSGEISGNHLKNGYFLFQRDHRADNKEAWQNFNDQYWGWNSRFKVNSLSSIMLSEKNNCVIKALLDMMLYYWKTQDVVIHYFAFQILYDDLVLRQLNTYKCDIVDDTLPHLLMGTIAGVLDFMSSEQILADQNIHKLTYFSGVELANLKSLLLGNLQSAAAQNQNKH